MRSSPVPPTLLGDDGAQDPAAARPRRAARRLHAGACDDRPDRTGERGEVSAAPPKTVPPNLPTGPAIAGSLGGGSGSSGSLPDWLRRLLQRLPAWHWWLLIASIVLALLCLLVPVIGIALAVIVVVGGVALRLWLDAQLAQPPQAGGPASVVDDETRTPAAVDELPTSSSFDAPTTVDPLRNAARAASRRSRSRHAARPAASRRRSATPTRST